MPEVTMPRLSDTMEEGTIGRWLKKPGENVERGEILLEIETDKATMELEAYDSGTLQKVLVQEGETVPIGVPIAIIGDGPVAETAGPAVANSAQTQTSTQQAAESERTPVASQAVQAIATEPTVSGNGRADDARVKASPVARRLAAEYGVDLRQIQGTGPGGRIIKENVEAFYQRQGKAPAPTAPAPAQPSVPTSTAATPPLPGAIEPLSRMRRAIAKRMTDAKPGVPHIYVTTDIDMGEALQLRKQINESGASAVKVSVNDMVVKAAAKALTKFPNVNSSYTVGADGQPGMVRHAQINIGVAIAMEEGLVAPVVVEADKKSLGTIAADIKDMAARAREGKIKPPELEGGTFTVSNLGMYDVVEFGMIITTPQAAAIAVGGVRQIPVVRDGEITIGEMLRISISADHRIVDGAVAAQYLQELKRLLQSPMSLLV